MNLLSVRSAFSDAYYTQSECLASMREANFWDELKPSSRNLLAKVLTGDSGIDGRHFCLDQLPQAWELDAEGLNNYYEKSAPALAANAVRKALDDASLSPSDVDVLFVSSCTGYLCPGLSSHIAEQLGLRPDVFMQDMTGFGCGAAVPLIRAAQGVIKNNPDLVAVTVSVEVCSAAFYVENDVGVLVSTCLFGDGAAAAVWSGRGGDWQVDHFQSLHIPEEREKIRFTNAEGKLRNQLHRTVPELAGKTVSALYQKRTTDPDEWITHGGGRDVIEQLEEVLPVKQLTYAREVMRKYGNLSSPSVLVALEQFLDENHDDAEHLWVCAFGAGFSAHSCELKRIS